MLNIAVCEDLELHQKYLSDKIRQFLNVSCQISVFSSMKALKAFWESNRITFDIIFMDIELGDGSGIQLSEEINRRYPITQIIYITAYTEYSSDVYKTNHTWYIDKQKIDTYLPLALDKALKSIQLLHSLCLDISWKKVHFSIPQKEIIYIERSLRVSEIHTSKTIYRTAAKLENLLEQLTDSFIICHRSYIINLIHITDFQKDIVTLNGKYSIPVSRSKYAELKSAYNMFLVGK